MTIPNDTSDYDFSGDPDEIMDLDSDGSMAPVPVYLAKTVVRQESPHMGSLVAFTVPVAGTQQPVQLLQRRPSRYRAFIKNPTGSGGSVILSENQAKLSGVNPAGYVVAAGEREQWESQQPVYAIAPAGGAVVTIYVLDQAWENIDNDDYTDSGN